MADRKKPGVAFWATVVVVVVLVYPLSFGPACWLARRGRISPRWTGKIFRPLVLAGIDGPESVRRVLSGYTETFAPRWKITIIENLFETRTIEGDILHELDYAAK